MVLGLFGVRILLVEVNIVPYKENINRPDAAAVVLLALEMLVKPTDKRVGVEELFGGFAFEFFFDYIVIFFILKPNAGRHGETELLFFGGGFGHMARSRLAHGILSVFFVYPERGRQSCRDLEHLFVEERHAQLKRVSHAHAVGFKQDITRHPHIYVEILHFGNVVIATAAVVMSAGYAVRSRCDRGLL